MSEYRINVNDYVIVFKENDNVDMKVRFCGIDGDIARFELLRKVHLKEKVDLINNFDELDSSPYEDDILYDIDMIFDMETENEVLIPLRDIENKSINDYKSECEEYEFENITTTSDIFKQYELIPKDIFISGLNQAIYDEDEENSFDKYKNYNNIIIVE